MIWKMGIAAFLETSDLRNCGVEGKAVETLSVYREKETDGGRKRARERWKCWTEENNKKEEGDRGGIDCSGNRDQGRKKEKDIWSHEVSPYNRLSSLTYEASFACHLLHHLDSRSSFYAPFLATSSFFFPLAPSVAGPPVRLLAMHRCIRSLHNYYSYRE